MPSKAKPPKRKPRAEWNAHLAKARAVGAKKLPKRDTKAKKASAQKGGRKGKADGPQPWDGAGAACALLARTMGVI